MEDVTGRTICRNIRNTYGGYLIAVLLLAAMFGYCTWLSLETFGLTDTVTVVMAVLTAAPLVCAVILLCKIAAVRQHRVFQRYGDADTLAANIRAGTRNPRFLTAPDRKFRLLITEQFLVSDADFRYYLELADVRAMHFQYDSTGRVHVKLDVPRLLLSDDQGKIYSCPVEKEDIAEVTAIMHALIPDIEERVLRY